MNEFTKDDTAQLKQRISKDLSLLESELTKRFRGVVALVLIGGFGRGEGKVMIDTNGSVSPVNDYDIVIVAENAISKHDLLSASSEISQKFPELPNIDLISISENNLPLIPPTIRNYEMKERGSVFYGNKNILDMMPSYTPKDIPLREAEILLFNRMIGLLESFSYDFKFGQPSKSEASFLSHQTSKAILACCTSLLLNKKVFYPTYQQRVAHFSNLYSEKKELVDMAHRALEIKTTPKECFEGDIVNLWFRAKKELIESLWIVSGTLHKRNFDTNTEFINCHANKYSPSLLQQLKYFLKKGGLQPNTKTNIEIAEYALLASISPNFKIDNQLANKAFLSLENIGVTITRKDWENARKKTVESWYKHLH